MEIEEEVVEHWCTTCGGRYKTKSALSNHVRVHSRKLDCDKCDWKFTNAGSLKRHIITVHDLGKKQTLHRCAECQFTTYVKKGLVEHLETAHRVSVKPQLIDFLSFERFLDWKKVEEEETVSRFIKPSSPANLANGVKKITYICHRAGHFSGKGLNRRSLKATGSNKINGFCPARMVVTLREDDSCSVAYTSAHVGHRPELRRLFLSKEERDFFASKIADKVPLDDILDQVRDSVQDGKPRRIHLVRRKDLQNIVKDYKLRGQAVTRSEACSSSVEGWAAHALATSDIVRLYKPRGRIDTDHPELSREDFVLVFFNQAQRRMLKEHGSDMICVDRAHDLDTCNYELYTVLVIDDLQQAFPAAFLLTDRRDAVAMTAFFKVIKQCLGGPLNPKVFMSDVAELFYTAWSSVMPTSGTERLYCPWHVDLAWRQNLNKIRGREKQISIYKALKTIMFQWEEKEFERSCRALSTELFGDGDTVEFGVYIRRFFDSPQRWAYCLRKQVSIDTDVLLENLHKSIKYLYTKGKSVKKTDGGIQAVMKMVRDKLIDRLVTTTKGGDLTTKLSDIQSRHADSEGLHVREESGSWTVFSKEGGKEYVVSGGEVVECQCCLRCPECDVCVHTYSCTCSDYQVKWVVCKHIHRVCTLLKQNSISTEDTFLDIYEGDESQGADSVITCGGETSQPSVDLTNKKHELVDFFSKSLESVITEEQLEAVSKHIATIQAVIAGAGSHPSTPPLNKAPLRILAQSLPQYNFSAAADHLKTIEIVIENTSDEEVIATDNENNIF